MEEYKKKLQENRRKTTPDQTNKTKPSDCSKNKGITNLICGNLTFAEHYLLNGHRIAQICQVYQQIESISQHSSFHMQEDFTTPVLLQRWNRVLGDWDSAGCIGNLYFILCELNQGWNLSHTE